MTLSNLAIKNACFNHFAKGKYDIQAIYLTGSRLRKQARSDSDYDLMIFVEPTLDVIFNHRQYISTQESFIANGIEFDCKIYEKAKLEQLLFKGNPNFLELFKYPAIYCNYKYDTNTKLFKLLEQSNLFSLNPEGAFKAFAGMIKHDEQKLIRATNLKRVNKSKLMIVNNLQLLGEYLNKVVPNNPEPDILLAIWEIEFRQLMSNIDTNLLDEHNIKKVRNAFKIDFIRWCHQVY